MAERTDKWEYLESTITNAETFVAIKAELDSHEGDAQADISTLDREIKKIFDNQFALINRESSPEERWRAGKERIQFRAREWAERTEKFEYLKSVITNPIDLEAIKAELRSREDSPRADIATLDREIKKVLEYLQLGIYEQARYGDAIWIEREEKLALVESKITNLDVRREIKGRLWGYNPQADIATLDRAMEEFERMMLNSENVDFCDAEMREKEKSFKELRR